MIFRILYKYLHDGAAVRDRVGEAIFFQNTPQEVAVEAEHLVISLLGGEVFNSLTNEIGVENARVQIACYSNDPHKADSLARVVRDRLSGYRGEATYLADDGTEATTVISVTRDSPTTQIDDPLDASDRWRYASIDEYSVFFNTSVPTHA